MLILTRRPHERIYIYKEGEEPVEIVIVYYGNSGCQAKIGVLAPEDYKIAREEILNKPDDECSYKPKYK